MKHRLDRFHAQKYWKHRSSHEWNRDPRTSATRCGTDNSRKFPRGAAECGGRGLGGVKLRMYRGAAYANENKWRNWAHSHTANTEHGRTARGTETHAAVVLRLSKNAVWAYECCQISPLKYIQEKVCKFLTKNSYVGVRNSWLSPYPDVSQIMGEIFLMKTWDFLITSQFSSGNLGAKGNSYILWGSLRSDQCEPQKLKLEWRSESQWGKVARHHQCGCGIHLTI